VKVSRSSLDEAAMENAVPARFHPRMDPVDIGGIDTLMEMVANKT